eukprot:Hpha_TRINITY_DN14941_c1_g1::TRINITY_DN14941_c1_g1_i1::g.143497::m.143497/K11436/PRMT3; type I protein arginine methyltransferase
MAAADPPSVGRGEEECEDSVAEESQDAARDADSGEGWDDDSAEEMATRAQGLFDPQTTYKTPREAFAAAAAAGFDVGALRQELGLQFYDMVKVVNYVRQRVQGGDTDTQSAVKAVRERAWDEDKWLAPVIQNDPLLWGDEEEDEEDDSDDAPPRAAPVPPESYRDPEPAEPEPAKAEPEPATKPEAAAPATAPATAPAPAPSNFWADIPPSDPPPARRPAPAALLSPFPDPTAAEVFSRAMGKCNKVKGGTVVDPRCGAGAYAMLAAQAGAGEALGVEWDEDKARDAMENVAANGLQGSVRVCEAESSITEAVPPASVDVLVSEWMGPGLLLGSRWAEFEAVRESVLKKGGAVLPDVGVIKCAAVDITALGMVGTCAGLVFPSSHRNLLSSACRQAQQRSVDKVSVIAEAGEAARLDLTTFKFGGGLDTTEMKLTHPGPARDVAGLVVWFDCEFSTRFCSEAERLSTAPGTNTRWQQLLLPFPTPIPLGEGGTESLLVRLRFEAEGGGGVLVSVRTPQKGALLQRRYRL